jgi:propanol-preferring alcohol dehydrogenase
MDEAITMAVEAGIRTTIEKQPLENINDIFRRLENGQVVGRVVLDVTSGEAG